MRIRSVKPEFWSSQSVGRLSRDSRLVFVGLWNLADDEGRLIADPKLIAATLLPYDSDRDKVVARALAELEEEGCLRRYAVGRDLYASLPGWLKHQKISHPSASRLPPESSGNPPESSGSVPAGKERKGEEGKGEEAFGGVDVKSLWNEGTRPPVPRWTTTENARKTALKARLREHPDAAFWASLVAVVDASDFLSGRKTDFKATPDWVLNPTNLTKILEGNYSNGASLSRAGGLTLPVVPSQQGHTTRDLTEEF